MHIPDGFIDGGTSLVAGAAAVAGVAACLKRSTRTLEEELAPVAGAVAAFVFAGQMLNFPVAGGTSGHLIGAVLAAVLVGPWLAAVCVTAVLAVQALLFADGGLTALGLNVVNMSLIAVFGGYVIFLVARRLLPASQGAVVAASAMAAWASVALASLAFGLEYLMGGTGSASAGTVTAAMLGVHVLVGIGEAVITALTVSVVLAVRPDLVYGTRGIDSSRPRALAGG